MASASRTTTMSRMSTAGSINTGRVSSTARRRTSAGLSSSAIRLIRAIVVTVLVLFVLVSLSAYAATLQYENNSLQKENAYIQAEIDSLDNQIVEETKVTKIEKTATQKYGMVYPTSENCITISNDKPTTDSLAATIKSEAYNN